MTKEINSPKPVNPSRDRWLLTGVSIVLAFVAAGVIMLAMVAGKRDRKTAPGFLLRDQQGRLTSLAQFRGKVVVLTFIDPECTQICPLTTQSMVEALKILGPAAASHVQLLGIDVNPLKNQIADVAEYTRLHELQGRWRFLTGSRAQLESVWRSYHVYVAVVKDDIEHSAIVYLIDENGDERTEFSSPMDYESVGDQAQAFAEGIAQLLPDNPDIPMSTQASQQQEAPSNPTDTLSVMALGTRRPPVVLGGAHPHLMLFFAGWLGEDSELSKNLAALDSYSILARRKGWPSPVAIDELPTEPSPTKARQELMPLAATLRTPIVEDASGRFADGYQVGDLPWFVLSSSSGKVLWSHDGWLSATALDQQVHAALAGI